MHICMWIKCKKTKQNLAEQDNKLGTLLEFETLGMNDISNLNMFKKNQIVEKILIQMYLLTTQICLKCKKCKINFCSTR